MRRLLAASALLALAAPPAGAQKLRARLGELVTFGDWGVPLRVGTRSADGQAIVPNDAFTTTASNGALFAFLLQWMSANAASAPIPSTGGGSAFRFVGGVPVRATPAPGPIFGEAATTLGRHAVLGGASYTGAHFSKVRGVPLDGVELTLAEDGATSPDAIDLRLSVDYDLAVSSFFATVGVLDRLDVGVVFPVVRSRLSGSSTARVVSTAAGGAPQAVIGGPASAPLLASTQSMDGSAFGLGDVAMRVKANLVDRPAGAIGVMTDVRAPTGDADNLLGSGTWSARGLALYSGRYGKFTPHASAGYLFYGKRSINRAVLTTLGTDLDVAPWATVALTALGQFHPGASEYQLPRTSTAGTPSNIPNIRDDALSGSAGVKLLTGGFRTVVNVLAPFTRGGPRPDFAYTFGVERDF